MDYRSKATSRGSVQRWSIDGTKALLTEHPFSAVPPSRVIGPRKRPVLAAPPQVQSIAEATGSCRSAPRYRWSRLVRRAFDIDVAVHAITGRFVHQALCPVYSPDNRRAPRQLLPPVHRGQNRPGLDYLLCWSVVENRHGPGGLPRIECARRSSMYGSTTGHEFIINSAAAERWN